jgi:hypothetical protein
MELFNSSVTEEMILPEKIRYCSDYNVTQQHSSLGTKDRLDLPAIKGPKGYCTMGYCARFLYQVFFLGARSFQIHYIRRLPAYVLDFVQFLSPRKNLAHSSTYKAIIVLRYGEVVYLEVGRSKTLQQKGKQKTFFVQL